MNWLNEIVCWNEVEYVPRCTAIWRFVSKGLHPFLLKNGYVLQVDVKEFASGIATILYMNRGASCLDAKCLATIPCNLEEEDHKSHYYHVLSEDKWDALWSQWSLWSDLQDDRGHDRCIDIQEYCWSQLDLDESPQTRVVEELLDTLEESPYAGRGEDVYLREAAESNEWGGFR
jgi:hypothetical protein